MPASLSCFSCGLSIPLSSGEVHEGVEAFCERFLELMTDLEVWERRLLLCLVAAVSTDCDSVTVSAPDKKVLQHDTGRRSVCGEVLLTTAHLCPARSLFGPAQCIISACGLFR